MENSEFTSDDEHRHYNYFGNYDRNIFVSQVSNTSSNKLPPGLNPNSNSDTAKNNTTPGLALFSTRRDTKTSTYNYFYPPMQREPVQREPIELSGPHSPQITGSDDEESGFFSESSISSNPFQSGQVKSFLSEKNDTEVEVPIGNERSADKIVNDNNPLTKTFFPNIGNISTNKVIFNNQPSPNFSPLNQPTPGYLYQGTPQYMGYPSPNLSYVPSDQKTGSGPFYFGGETAMKSEEIPGQTYETVGDIEKYFNQGARLRHVETDEANVNEKKKEKGKLIYPPGLGKWPENDGNEG